VSADLSYLKTPTRADWETPQWLFDALNTVWRFDLDVCATPENAKCSKYYTPQDNGLIQPWEGRCWMNPPYGREIRKWAEKAFREFEAGSAITVGLLPVRTDAIWWHAFVQGKARVDYLRGRLQYEGAQHNAPFPSALVYWLPDPNNFRISRSACPPPG
jgi:phage N-6-adenine-methyltransferase